LRCGSEPPAHRAYALSESETGWRTEGRAKKMGVIRETSGLTILKFKDRLISSVELQLRLAKVLLWGEIVEIQLDLESNR
jgi:hypothetical protein